MPFTVTHVAAAIPVAWLCRWRVPFSALAIGAMVPDLSGYYPRLLDYHATHSLQGVLTHCLPMGVICYYVYQMIFKRPLVDLLPAAASDRLRPWSEKTVDFAPLTIFAVFACAFIGSLTHVVWDAFTHKNLWGVQMFPALESIVFSDAQLPIRWYALIQHGSSIVLLPPLLIGFVWWIGKQPRPAISIDRAQMPRGISWSVLALVALGVVQYMWMLLDHRPHLHWLDALGFAVKRGGAITLLLTTIYCLGMHLIWWREERREPYVTESPIPEIIRAE